jgi:UDP:flavonoid glycosyltransferase YjiC (YdhE family)
MRVTVLSVGSRGDLHPLVGFGAGLASAGHEVRVGAFPKYEPQVRAAGLDFAPLAEGRLSQGSDTAETRWWGRRGSRMLPSWFGLIVDVRTVASRRLADAMAACDGAEVIVCNELALLLSWQIGEHLGVPLVRARLCPPPRRAHKPVAVGVRQAAWLAARPWLKSIRRNAGLPPLPLREPLGRLDERRTLELYAFSPAVAPSWLRRGPWTEVTGYWLPAGGSYPEAPQRLLDFLAAGPPPVCVDFGSMIDADPVATTELVVQALDGAGCRGVLLGERYGWSEAALPDTVLHVDAVSHDWLLPRCAAVVHHGGAGTVAATLMAGVPSVIVPHMLDQYAWGRRINELGAAPKPIRRRRLKAGALRARVEAAVGEASMRARARELGERIRAEDGIGSAVEAFVRHLSGVGETPRSEVTTG